MKRGGADTQTEAEKLCQPNFKLMDIDAGEVDFYLQFNRNLTFNERLFLLIYRTEQHDSDIYKKARIDRRLFSKIRCNEKYIPSKKTVIALCLALELSRDEADLLLSSAGYSLSPANDYDLIIAFCIDKKIYDFFDINEVLLHFGFDVF
ncbi:helix-turn-helix domain-containing protein [Oscillospiraceae bacterium LCP25S3_F9]